MEGLLAEGRGAKEALEEVTFDQSPEGGEGGREPWLYVRQEQF